MLVDILKSTDPACRSRLDKLTGRLRELEELDSETARQRTKATFGREMTPSQVVDMILADVRREGDSALFHYAERLDGATLSPKTVRVSPEEIQAAGESVDPKLLDAMRLAADRIRDFQERILPEPVPMKEHGGVKLGLRFTPVDRAGIYVPGGLAAYPSTVLMSVIPAQAAGVRSIAVVTPTTRDGSPTGALNPAVLAACDVCGVDEVYRVGGVQAIGALAYGTASIEPVDFIAGPGNLFVMLAKKKVFGQVMIDMLAGPSEVLIIADDSADPDYVAADMLAQAEHDPMASAVLLALSDGLAVKVRDSLEKQAADLERSDIASESLRNYGLIVVCEDEAEAVAFANDYAPEHCEVMTTDPDKTANMIRHAGALFIGTHTPEPLGDYVAGPSHTLPTGGTAKFFSGLSSLSFLKTGSLISATSEGHAALRDAVRILADSESLGAHRRSSEIRFDGN